MAEPTSASVAAPPSDWWRGRWGRSILIGALLHQAVVQGVNLLIFLLSRFPPDVYRLDSLIVGLVGVHHFLHLPRLMLRHLWLSENTPTAINWALFVANSLIWGGLLALGWRWWRRGQLAQAWLG